MILKIATTGKCRPCAWWYMDGIQQLTQHLLMTDQDYLKGAEADEALLDNGGTMVRLISYRTTDGKERSVVFNTVAFLLNDEGKTIERIEGS